VGNGWEFFAICSLGLQAARARRSQPLHPLFLSAAFQPDSNRFVAYYRLTTGRQGSLGREAQRAAVARYLATVGPQLARVERTPSAF
jgi:hypothetical protein